MIAACNNERQTHMINESRWEPSPSSAAAPVCTKPAWAFLHAATTGFQIVQHPLGSQGLPSLLELHLEHETTTAVARWRVSSRFLLRWILAHTWAWVDCRDMRVGASLHAKFCSRVYRVQYFNWGDVLNCTIGEVYGCLEKFEFWNWCWWRLRDSTKSVIQRVKPNLPEGNSRFCWLFLWGCEETRPLTWHDIMWPSVLMKMLMNSTLGFNIHGQAKVSVVFIFREGEVLHVCERTSARS